VGRMRRNVRVLIFAADNASPKEVIRGTLDQSISCDKLRVLMSAFSIIVRRLA
jgi:hypothetical protein